MPLPTERIDPRFAELDAWPTPDALAAMLDGQMAAVAAVRPSLSAMAVAIDAAATRLGKTGRLIFVGAGTSGRIGVQDGSELLPTFNWPADRVAFIVAGGLSAIVRSVEGAEDDVADGRRQVDALRTQTTDVVIGIAASGTTPFTIAAITRARRRGSMTVAIASNADTPLLAASEHPLLIDTGPEVIAGSTRMKAGTAHKVALNLISTGIMLRLGRVHGGIMVEMQPTNAKLKRRAVAIVAHIAQCTLRQAQTALTAADGSIKLATLLALGVPRAQADARLLKARGHLRRAMTDLL
jgi:N-acetylmuramic acid 6-phosphate etherase